MSYDREFEHDGVQYTFEPQADGLHAIVTCSIGGRLMWSPTLQVLSANHNRALMILHGWSVKDGYVLLHTLGEHMRGGTRHEPRVYRMDRRRVERVDSDTLQPL